MEYNNIIINNNNLLHSPHHSNNYNPYEYFSKRTNSYYDINTNQNHPVLNNDINNINKPYTINENIPFSSRGNYKRKNDIYSFGNIEQKRINKTPQARINKIKNFYNNNIYFDLNKAKNNQNNIVNNKYLDFHDIRVDYCLEMLNLNNIKSIFHQRNLGFNEMLYLSQKDMKKMGIPVYSQLIIQKFTKDYLQKASYYTAEELEKFFQIYYRDNIRKIASDKKIQGDFPIRSFSPIAYNTRNLLKKYDYNLFNINNFPNSNENRNINNLYKKINNNNYINSNNNNYITNLNQRNCLSASKREKNQIVKRKENIIKNIRYSRSLPPNHKRIKNISSSNSQNFMNNSPMNNIKYNNYLFVENQKYEQINETNLNNYYKGKYSHFKNDINEKISQLSKKFENYINNIKHYKRKEGNFYK